MNHAVQSLIGFLDTETVKFLVFNHGPVVAVLAWFMLRGEKIVLEIRSLSHRIDGMTKAMLVDVLSRDSCGPSAREMAREMLAKIQARENPGGTRPPV